MIAPPVPSETVAAPVCALAALHTTTPSAAHWGAPRPLRRRAKMSWLPLRESTHTTIAPPVPSGVIARTVWSDPLVQSGTLTSGSLGQPAWLADAVVRSTPRIRSHERRRTTSLEPVQIPPFRTHGLLLDEHERRASTRVWRPQGRRDAERRSLDEERPRGQEHGARRGTAYTTLGSGVVACERCGSAGNLRPAEYFRQVETAE